MQAARAILAFLCVGLLLAAYVEGAPKGRKKDGAPAADTNAPPSLDVLAKQVFDAANKDKDDSLNKKEYRTAQGYLVRTMQEWAGRGWLGMARERSKREKVADPPPIVVVDPKKKSQITILEFMQVTRAAHEQADLEFRAARDAYNAQLKAMQSRNRGRSRAGTTR